jgi:hypothetical protein
MVPAHGLVRLYSLYQFDVKMFSEEGRISTTLDNGQVVLSEPSLLPVNCKLYSFMSVLMDKDVEEYRAKERERERERERELKLAHGCAHPLHQSERDI